ncbi:hypothetical protein RhoFasB10_03254 [Rhodococcus sp. B10]|nr:hypothetical protein [Rhodococcus sp. B10]
MAKVEAILNVTHDKQRYAAGDTFEVTDVQAEALIASGAAKKTAQAATAEPKVKDEKPAETKAPETKKAAQSK